MRPDKYLRMGAAMRRVRNDRRRSASPRPRSAARTAPGLIDERGTLTWKQIDDRCDALAAALQNQPGGTPKTVAVMCRNHRGFIEALVGVQPDRRRRAAAQHRRSPGPRWPRSSSARAPTSSSTTRSSPRSSTGRCADRPDATAHPRLDRHATDGTARPLDALIDTPRGSATAAAAVDRKSDIILLTSGTTGTPEGRQAFRRQRRCR